MSGTCLGDIRPGVERGRTVRCIVSFQGSTQKLLLGIHTALCLVSFVRSKTPIMHCLSIELICKFLVDTQDASIRHTQVHFMCTYHER